MTDAEILSVLDDHTTKWAECAAQYYRQRNGEAGQRCDGYSTAMQGAARLIRELPARLDKIAPTLDSFADSDE